MLHRYFRLLGHGHVARSCGGPDTSNLWELWSPELWNNLCYKCEGSEHKAKSYTAPERCVLCMELGVSQQDLAMQVLAKCKSCLLYTSRCV